MKLNLLETWSKYHEGEVPFDLPEGWRLVTHQMEVYEALRDPDIDVVFDTAMTGDGKTLAAILPAVYQRDTLDKALFAYPTNELIRDQFKQFGSWEKNLGFQLSRYALDSASLTAYAKEIDIHRNVALEDIAYLNDAVLTNPDIFVLLQRAHYDRQKTASARIAQTWLNQFRYIVLDEFHIFGTPQATTVLDAIAFSRASLGDKFASKFLFLSATPSGILVRKLENAGLNFREVKGQYQHGGADEKKYRRILHEVELELTENSGSVENWVVDNIEWIKSFFEEHRGTKGLILVNGLAVAKRTATFLRENFDGTVAENTSLTGKEEKEESLKADLVVATSTVDVGVDFSINLLIFESTDAGTFIQRLGRLGRHDGFEVYRAVALLPDWAVNKFPEHYTNGQAIDRETFFDTVRNKIYRKPQEFLSYVKRWGGVSAGIHHAKLNRYHYLTLRERYSEVAKRLLGSFAYPASLAEFKNHRSIIRDLEAFRGSSSIDAWVFDSEAGAVKSMSILRLLRTTDFKLIDESEARRVSENHDVAFHTSEIGL